MASQTSCGRLFANIAAISLIWSSAAQGQVTLAHQKTQAEIEKIEAEKQKVVSDIINASRSANAGSATVTGPELSAEGLLLSRHVQEQTARAIAQSLGSGTEPISIVFGDQPASTAEYLAIEHGKTALKENLEEAASQARKFYEKRSSTSYRKYLAFDGGVGLALTAITTVASLLRVNTTIAGAALPTPNEQYKAILTKELSTYHWAVDPPRALTTATPYADTLLAELKPAKDEAEKYYAKYLAHLEQKDGKTGGLGDDEVIVGQALATALSDYSTLEKGLFTPVNGVLPATVIEEQKASISSAPNRQIVYIQYQKAALTTVTKQGTFTGIVGVPAYVSASHVVEYSVFRPGKDPLLKSARYDTPVMRVTGVREWLTPKAEVTPVVGTETSGGS